MTDFSDKNEGKQPSPSYYSYSFALWKTDFQREFVAATPANKTFAKSMQRAVRLPQSRAVKREKIKKNLLDR